MAEIPQSGPGWATKYISHGNVGRVGGSLNSQQATSLEMQEQNFYQEKLFISVSV